MDQAATEFWNSEFTELAAAPPPPVDDATLHRAMEFFGDLHGKSVLDIGCGLGGTSIALARLGAQVTAIDLSPVAIDALARFAAAEGLAIKAVVADAMRIDELGQFDRVIGSMILHHLEPFGDFAVTLKKVLKPGGKAFFLENSAASRVLVWFREHVIGKLWMPKYGDKDEFPLKPQEVDMLRQHLSVKQEFPSLLFFSLVPLYLLKNRGQRFFGSLDNFFYRFEGMRRYSYRQHLLIERI